MKTITAKLDGQDIMNFSSVLEFDEELKPLDMKCPDTLVIKLTSAMVSKIKRARELIEQECFSSIEFYSESTFRTTKSMDVSTITPMRNGVRIAIPTYTLDGDPTGDGDFTQRIRPVLENEFFKLSVCSVFSHRVYVEIIISDDSGDFGEIVIGYSFHIDQLENK